VKVVRDVYRRFTEKSGLWRDGAVERLDRTGRRQFWLNTLLAQSLVLRSPYREGRSLIMACDADRSARAMCDAVRVELRAPATLCWEPWESIVGAIEGHDDWRVLFVSRYLDFAPVRHLLATDDPRRVASPLP
jgi:hypothetical protein